ncbi:hypothetical protein BHT96_21465 [Bacillus licheniformis]|nr:hypothetical protein BHT96_21465 [Bacillus licheniformis]
MILSDVILNTIKVAFTRLLERLFTLKQKKRWLHMKTMTEFFGQDLKTCSLEKWLLMVKRLRDSQK